MKGFRTICLLICLFCLPALSTEAGVEKSEETAAGSKARVGVFDSRALALAYGRSEPFMQYVKALKAEYEKAVAAGDEKRMKELDAEGPAQQELLHKQCFSTWPVDNILEKIKEKIPGIAKQADVDFIINKWDIVYQQPGVACIDITDLMVKPFNPDEKTMKIIREMQNVAPVPIEAIGKCEH